MHRPDKRVSNILRLGTEPGAVVDERPADWRARIVWLALGFALGVAIGLIVTLGIVDRYLDRLERRISNPVYPTGR